MSDKKQQLKDFMYIETSDNPMVRVDNHKILSSIIDPTTGKAYDGIILEGEFASLDVLNNNNRIYTPDNYIGFIEVLKRMCHSPKGLYGNLEHPQGYNTNLNEVSHKILDIWYNKDTKKVFGIIMLLNTPKGKIAQEIIKSGGQIAVSARGGGSEIANPDGTITAQLKLLVTFDIVYHPGFTTAITEFTKLNESLNIDNQKVEKNGKVTLCIYEDSFSKMNQLFESYKIENHPDLNFLQWCVSGKKLFESQQETESQEQNDIAKLQKNQTANQDNVEDELEDAVQQQLNESLQNLQKQDFLSQIKKANIKLGNAIYDNSAGFIDMSENQK